MRFLRLGVLKVQDRLAPIEIKRTRFETRAGMISGMEKEQKDEALKIRAIQVNENITLEQLKIQDAERVFALTEANREYLSKFLPWPESTKAVSDSRDFIELMLKRRGNNEEYGYGIKYDESIVGHISLMHLNDGQSPEIGYWVAKEYSGKGITTLAARALTDFGINELGLDAIIIRADPNNIASNKIAEKIGYIFEGQVDDETYRKLNIWRLGSRP